MTTSLFITQFRLLITRTKEALENTVGKGENAGNQHFLLFLQCFLPYHTNVFDERSERRK